MPGRFLLLLAPLLLLIATITTEPLYGAAREQATCPPIQLRLMGELRLPTDTYYKDTKVGGLSGVDYDAKRDLFWAISDDRGWSGIPRFYTFKLQRQGRRLTAVKWVGVQMLRGPDGEPYKREQVDAEAVRLLPAIGDEQPARLLWSSEGHCGQRKKPEQGCEATPPIQPSIQWIDMTGHWLRALSIPTRYHYRPHLEEGVRDNKSFESLTILPESKLIATAVERPLYGDGRFIRIALFDPKSGHLARSYAYPYEERFAVVELLSWSERFMLALERRFTRGVGAEVKLQWVDLAGASNVKTRGELADGQFDRVGKQEILDLGTLAIDQDNLEAMSWGPVLENGHSTLLLVSDNNFGHFDRPGQPKQVSQFLWFEVMPGAGKQHRACQQQRR
uniref:Phytase-like domain-containing protein n=1 Tax=Magnetococcus massalia (strain MO-1) TaxID=451514 RepID=A0A1S7LL89_MAGMO|nr:conserved exported protein of unknown function [Candidatus Magnetococcus massalia]